MRFKVHFRFIFGPFFRLKMGFSDKAARVPSTKSQREHAARCVLSGVFFCDLSAESGEFAPFFCSVLWIFKQKNGEFAPVFLCDLTRNMWGNGAVGGGHR